MQQAAYGVFRKGQIILDEPVAAPDESNVIVVFLEKQTNKLPQNKNDLLNIFNVLGAWEDSRDTDAIIAEIEQSRISRKTDIVL